MRVIRGAIALLLGCLWTLPCLAQGFPSKPIQVVTTTAGAAADILARQAAQALTDSLGVPALVQNRPGNATLPVMLVAKADADGHTLLSLGGSFFWLQPYLSPETPYDPVRDFAPVTLMANTPNLLVVPVTLPVQNVRELIAYARTRPGILNFSHANVGSGNHLAVELFKSMGQIDIVGVSYKGAAPAITALLAGEAQGMFPTPSAVLPHIKSGKIRALGVTSAQRTELAPGIPTVSESGLPGFISGVDYVVFAPARTPNAVIDQLNKIIVQNLRTPDSRKKMFNLGLEVVGSTPAELASAMKADMDRLGKLIREKGIRGE